MTTDNDVDSDHGLERNRRNVVAVYDLMFNQCKPREAIGQYAGHTYIQHNPLVEDGKEAFIAYFERMDVLQLVPPTSRNNTMF